MAKRSSATNLRPSAEEIAVLRARLEEAEETLAAIRAGEVDALVVSGPAGERVFTLEGADHRYRRLVETMNEGALLVAADGTILYCNVRFAQIVDVALECVLGRPISSFVAPKCTSSLDAILQRGRVGTVAAEIFLVTPSGRSVPVYVSATASLESDTGVCLVATDLSEQKRNEEMVAAERLAGSILDQAADVIVVCDPSARIVRASQAAHRLAGENPLFQPFSNVFPIRTATSGKIARSAEELVAAALKGEEMAGVEVCLEGPDRQQRSLLLSAGPLLNSQKKILGTVLSLTDITERKRAEEREKAGRERAEESNRAKDEFLATISHELRTPLNAMLGWARMLRTGDLPDATRPRALEAIERNALAQAQLVEDLLDISRIVSGKLRLEIGPVDLEAIIEAAIDTVRPAIEARGIRFQQILDPDCGDASGDPNRLQQVIWNLLSNAVKFSPRGGSVTITLQRVESQIEICVSDSGQGIASEFIPHVFERFKQADGSITRSNGGLGLGLAISRHIVELHGGVIAVHSDGAQRGATFTVSLPRAAVRRATDHAARLHPTSGRDVNFECPPELAGLNVLVVDDEDDARSLLVTILERCGSKVSAAASVDAALKSIEERVPDVLVSDIGMPERDGYELIRRIRALPSKSVRNVPAAALTAYARAEDRRKALLAGFQMHVAKPVEPAELVAVIANLARIGSAMK